MNLDPLDTVWNDREARTAVIRQASSRPWYRYADALAVSLPPGSALDVGCGVGEFMELLNRKGFRTEGVDGSREQVSRIRRRGLQAQVADLERGLAYPAGTFDLVSCLEVIEHVARAEFLLSEIHRVLKPRGALLLSTPNFSFLNNRFYYLRGKVPLGEGIHLRFLNPARLNALLTAAGFQIERRNSYGIVPLVSTVNLRLLKRPARLWRVPAVLESWLAYDLIYLARKCDSRPA